MRNPKKTPALTFNSKDFSFRPTAMSDAFLRAGTTLPAYLVREANIEKDGGIIHARIPRNVMGQALV